MAGKVEIINLALTNLSKATITSIDEASEPARRAKAVWDFCREAVLRDYDWPFAKKIKALTISSLDEVPNWNYVYALPSDYLQARGIFNQGLVETNWMYWLNQNGVLSVNTEPQSYMILHSENGSYKILAANIEDAYLKYTSNVIDTTMFDNSFVIALSYYLASVLAPVMTGDSKRSADLLQLYNFTLASAKANSHSETYELPDNTKNSPYYDCR